MANPTSRPSKQETVQAKQATDQASVYKTDRGNCAYATPTLVGTSQALATSIGGLADATAAGFYAFRDQINDDNLLRINLDNGLVEGSLAAANDFLLKLSDVLKQVSGILKDSAARSSGAAPRDTAIDYDHLANLVAEKLRKTSASDA
jgi:hypothetical protein